jgi:hypothetical protein
VNNDNTETPFVLILDQHYREVAIYTLAKMYGNSPMSYTPNARDKTTLVEELRAIADMIEDDELVTYERTVGFRVAEWPQKATATEPPKHHEIEGPIERAMRESREAQSGK